MCAISITNTFEKRNTEHKIDTILAEIDYRSELLQSRVLDAFSEYQVSEADLAGSTGYGYSDLGREKLESIISRLFDVEAALVRPQLISGTHAIASVLYGLLRSGEHCLYVTGRPYDTLQSIIFGPSSLQEMGVELQFVDRKPSGNVDIEEVLGAIQPNTKLICLQRSSGYSSYSSVTVDQIEGIIREIRLRFPHLLFFVDNCYGEFVELKEPTHVGADIIAGSLIKNMGGGLVKSGGYIAGKSKLVDLAANRLFAPGIGREGGATYGYMRDLFQGLFMAPHIVAESLKGAVFASSLFEDMGFNTLPKWQDDRTDIIQKIIFGDSDEAREMLISFCNAIQSASPIDSHVIPIPGDMPGYNDKIIMAAGTFIQGATIELTADGPLRPPYTAYMQGGLNYAHIKIAVKRASQKMQSNNTE